MTKACRALPFSRAIAARGMVDRRGLACPLSAGRSSTRRGAVPRHSPAFISKPNLVCNCIKQWKNRLLARFDFVLDFCSI